MRWLFLLLLVPLVNAQEHTVQVDLAGQDVDQDGNGTAIWPVQVSVAMAGGVCVMPGSIVVPFVLETASNGTANATIVPESVTFTVSGQSLSAPWTASQIVTVVVEGMPGTNVTVRLAATPISQGCNPAVAPSLAGATVSQTFAWAPLAAPAEPQIQQELPGIGLLALLAVLMGVARVGARLK